MPRPKNSVGVSSFHFSGQQKRYNILHNFRIFFSWVDAHRSPRRRPEPSRYRLMGFGRGAAAAGLLFLFWESGIAFKTPIFMRALTFQASNTFKSGPLQPSAAKSAGSFFASDESLRALLSDADNVEGSGSTWSAVLPMSSFPGIKVTSTNFFNVKRSDDTLSIELLNSTSTATGPKFLVSIFEASQATPPKTASVNTISIIDDGSPRLQSDVSLSITMQVGSQTVQFLLLLLLLLFSFVLSHAMPCYGVNRCRIGFQSL